MLGDGYVRAADERQRVQLAFSRDGGASFGPPAEIDAEAPPGRGDAVLDDAGEAQTREREDFALYARAFGLREADFGREIVMGRGRARIVGIKPRATKRPILVEAANGRRYVMGADAVKRQLAREVYDA